MQKKTQSKRDKALDRLPSEARARLDAWAASEHVSQDDPAWETIGSIAEVIAMSARGAQAEITSAAQKAAENAAPLIARAAARQLKARVGLRAWVLAGLAQAVLVGALLYTGSTLSIFHAQKEFKELREEVKDKKMTLDYLRQQTHGVRLIRYSDDPVAEYIVLPRQPARICDGKPCLRFVAEPTRD